MAGERYVDRAEIAFLMEVDVRTITNWVRSSDFPSRVKGKERSFPVLKCLRWRTDRDVADAVTAIAPPPPDNLFEAEQRKAIADAEMAELRVAKFKSELVDSSVVAKEIDRAFNRVSARLKSTPGEFAPQLLQPLTMPEAVAILRRLVATTLTALQTDFNTDERDDPESAGDAPEEGAA
ncbi:MAG: Phage packaging protein Nu1 [Gemmatimonadetes bacterium]|nr:Phage packaging protein Nu1 [Gemmatimonadota bacterium]